MVKKRLQSCDSDAQLSEDFSNFFNAKLETIHQKINANNIHPPPLPVQRASSSLDSLPLVTTSDVIALIQLLKPKPCLIDPLPVCIFKEYAQQLAPTVRNIVNNSLSNASVNKELKVSIMTSIYKRKHLPVNELSSYRPVAQWSFVAKLLEKHVAQHLRLYLENNKINGVFQSAYRPHHSTGTAVIQAFSDICISMGRKREVILCLLDLRSAFDTLTLSRPRFFRFPEIIPTLMW